MDRPTSGLRQAEKVEQWRVKNAKQQKVLTLTSTYELYIYFSCSQPSLIYWLYKSSFLEMSTRGLTLDGGWGGTQVAGNLKRI